MFRTSRYQPHSTRLRVVYPRTKLNLGVFISRERQISISPLHASVAFGLEKEGPMSKYYLLDFGLHDYTPVKTDLHTLVSILLPFWHGNRRSQVVVNSLGLINLDMIIDKIQLRPLQQALRSIKPREYTPRVTTSVHGCPHPESVFVNPQGGYKLIDWYLSDWNSPLHDIVIAWIFSTEELEALWREIETLEWFYPDNSGPREELAWCLTTSVHQIFCTRVGVLGIKTGVFRYIEICKVLQLTKNIPS